MKNNMTSAEPVQNNLSVLFTTFTFMMSVAYLQSCFGNCIINGVGCCIGDGIQKLINKPEPK